MWNKRPRCNRKNCNRPASVYPVLMCPAPAATGSNEKAEIQLGLRICESHATNYDPSYYVSDEGWKQIIDAFISQGKVPPNRDSIYVIFKPIKGGQ